MLRPMRVGVGGFKSIKDLQPLGLRPVNVLIGANGSGKSNLISFFRLLNAIADHHLQDFVARAGGADILLHYGAKATPALWALIYFEGKTGPGSYFFTLSSTATDSLIFSQEQVIYRITQDSGDQPKQLGSGQKETLLMEGENEFHEVWELLANIQTYHFHDTSENAPVRKHSYIEENCCLRKDAGNLAAFLYALKRQKPQYYRRIVDTIRLLAPFFDEFVLAPRRENPRSILLNWKDRDSEHLFGPHQLSDGTIRAMALVTLLLQPEDSLPAMIVLDEPEIGLHPHALEIVASLIRSVSTHTTVIVATQSVSFVNHFAPEDVVVVTRSGSQSQFQRQDSKSLEAWLEEYSVGELWEKNVIGGAPSR